MSQEGITPSLAGAQNNIAQELMEEDLKKELERNQLATKMAMAKEAEAHEAKRRAQDAQVMMHAMLQKYEEMKSKLDNAKTALAETAVKTQQKEEIIEKIQTMKDRIENYSNRKAAVEYLQDHVQLKFDQHSTGLEFLKDCHEESEKYQKVQQAEEEKAERVKQLQEMMKQKERQVEKTSQIKVMLERQLEIGEKRAAEQNRIATVREKMLELKMKELELQKAKLARKKKEQEEKERATEDFIAMIDKQLEDMENKTTDPREKREAVSAILERHFNEKEKQEEQAKTGAISKKPVEEKKSENKKEKKKVKSPEPVQETPVVEKKEIAQPVEQKSVKETEKVMSPEPQKGKNKKKNKNKNKNKQTSETQKQPEPTKVEVSQATEISKVTEAPLVEEKKEEPVKTAESTAKPVKTAEQIKKEVAEYINKSKAQQEAGAVVVKEEEGEETPETEKLSEEEVKNMVAKIEHKSQTIRDDIADMAMSEQYLRTKQALLKAKKKEQEMQIAQKVASIRETEVEKMREKVAKMQELLSSRRQELKITEEIIHEKDGAKKELDKKIEASIRRQSFVEKKIVEKVMFEKPKKKKK